MDEQNEIKTIQVNPGYALGQIAKALTTADEHADRETRDRARVKVDKWLQVLHGVFDGSIAPGSRTPVADVPAWATLEVVTGGFATGNLLAGGPLLDHEHQLLEELDQPEENPRRTLNAYYLTEEGMSRLRSNLSGRYEINVPEEGALLVVAWLLDNGRPAMARNLIDEIAPFFDRLRFYPIPVSQPRRFGTRVYVQDVASTIKDLERIEPNTKVRGIVDIIAIRKDHRPTVGQFMRGDLFEIVLIQVKGGTARWPSASDVERLRAVARVHRARHIVLAEWRQGSQPRLYRLRSRNAKELWAEVEADTLFGS